MWPIRNIGILQSKLSTALHFAIIIYARSHAHLASHQQIRTIWESLDDIFRDVCKEEGVLVPRRW
jgi:adenosine deaminase